MGYVPLDFIPLWGFFLLASALGLVAVEGGYRLGRWRHRRAREEKETPVGAMVASGAFLFDIVTRRHADSEVIRARAATAAISF